MNNKKIKEATPEEIETAYVFGDVRHMKEERKQFYEYWKEQRPEEYLLLYSKKEHKCYKLRPSLSQECADSMGLGLANRLVLSEKRRKKVLNKKVNEYIESDFVFFITLTFRSDFFVGKNDETISRYVKRFLKENCYKYVVNVDYGEKHDRLHFHGVVVLKTNDSLSDFAFHRYKNNLIYCSNFVNWNHGFSVVQKVRKETSELMKDTDKNYLQLSNYINKLTNHALKNTGRPPRIIYSRKTSSNVKRKENE